MTRNKLLTLLTLMLVCMGAFCVPAFAYDGSDQLPGSERFDITTAWSDGDLLHIDIKDADTGYSTALEMRLSDYAQNAEKITVQVVDENGNASGAITIANPFYVPPVTGNDSDGDEDNKPTDTELPASESAVPDNSKPFTPDGAGTVVDNMTEQNGKEFFTITTENGNDFYLIVDRQRNGENVYLLNAVTENDLMALAQKGDGSTQSAVPNPSPPAQTEPTPTPEPSVEPVPETKDNGNTSTIIFVVLALVAVGGAGYYIKIVRPKQQASSDDGEDSEYEDDTDLPDDLYDSEIDDNSEEDDSE